MIKDIRDFDGIENHIKSSKKGFAEAIIEYYSKLGARLGYTVRENAPVIRYGVNIGKIDLIWIETNVVFTTEFNSIDNLLRNLWKIIEIKPGLAVIIVSSKSNCKPSDVSKLIKNSGITQGVKENFMILDVGRKEIVE